MKTLKNIFVTIAFVTIIGGILFFAYKINSFWYKKQMRAVLSEKATITSRELFYVTNTIGNCEYLIFFNSADLAVTHKGDCSNHPVYIPLELAK